MVPMKYKLKFDETMTAPDERAEAISRMARYGLWLGDGWWEPSPSQDAEARIEREGFIIIDKE